MTTRAQSNLTPLKLAEHQNVDRLLRETIVDKNDAVTTSAIVAAYHLHHRQDAGRDVVRRCLAELEQATRAPPDSHQIYPAYALSIAMKSRDPVSLDRTLRGAISGPRSTSSYFVKSGLYPPAHMMLIRHVTRLLHSAPSTLDK